MVDFKLENVMVYQLCRLTADTYSVPKGTLGYVAERCEHISDAFVIQWLSHSAGSSSVPVYEDDLEEAGTFSVPLIGRYKDALYHIAYRKADPVPTALEALGDI